MWPYNSVVLTMVCNYDRCYWEQRTRVSHIGSGNVPVVQNLSPSTVDMAAWLPPRQEEQVRGFFPEAFLFGIETLE